MQLCNNKNNLFHFSGLRRLEKPLLDLNVTRTSTELASVYYVAALPGGADFVINYISYNKTDEVLKMSSQGKITQVIYTCVNCSYINGLLVLGEHLYIIHRYCNGTVIETRVSDGGILRISNIPDVREVFHSGSLSNKPDRIPDK